MLPRRSRLSRQDLGEFRPEMRADSPHFSVAIGARGPHSRFAIVVSKKVARLAVTRHLLKRRITAVLKDVPADGRSIVVYAKAGSASLPFKELSQELSGLLRGKI